MADMKRIKGRIAETIYPNGTGAITAESHQALLLEMVDDINAKKADQSELVATQESLEALTDTVNNLPQGGGDVKADGIYPDLTAGDLAGRGESVPAEFGFRASGGKSIKDGRAYIKRIKGNSVVWNQLMYNGDFSKGAANWYAMNNNSFSVDNGVATIKLESDPQYEYWAYITPDPFPFEPNRVLGHKYLFKAEIWLPKPADVIISASGVTMTNNRLSSQPSNIWLLAGVIGEATESKKQGFAVYPQQIKAGYVSGDIWRIRNIGTYDLTKMFGAGYEPTTIEEFYQRIPQGIDVNTYNEGQVIHCNTESIKSVGDNAWDEEWESGNIDANGQNEVSATRIRSKNYIDVLPNAEYCFTIPKGMTSNDMSFFFYDSEKKFIGATGWIGYQTKKITTLPNARYARFRLANFTTYNHDIMIRLDHSGWKTEVLPDYQPYWQDTLSTPIICKYFPQGMKSAGTAHDEIRYNKATNKWEAVQRIGSVDMGIYRWYKDSSKDFFKYEAPIQIGTYYLCGKYINISVTQLGVERGINVIDSGRGTTHLRISDLSYTNEAEFNASLQGLILYYELAEPIVTEIAEDFRDYYNVADFGTEMSQSSVPSAPFSADIIYQFNAVDMIREHEAEITELQNIIATMQAQLTSLINGGQ